MKISSSVLLSAMLLTSTCFAARAQSNINQTLFGVNSFSQQNAIGSTSSGVTAIAGGSQGAGVSLNQIGDSVSFFQAGALPVTISQGIGDTQIGASFTLISTNTIGSSSSSPFGFAAVVGPQTSLNQGNVVHIGIASGGTLSLSQTSAPTAASSSTTSNTLAGFGVFGGGTVGGYAMTPPTLQQAISNLNAATLNIGGAVRVQLDQNGAIGGSFSSTNSAAAGVVTGSAALSGGSMVASPGSISVGASSNAQNWLNSFLGSRTNPTYQTITVGK